MLLCHYGINRNKSFCCVTLYPCFILFYFIFVILLCDIYEVISIDEKLCAYRGRIGIKQYNPSKPAECGLLYWDLWDSTIPYIYFTLPYGGKPNNVGLNEASNFFVSCTDE